MVDIGRIHGAAADPASYISAVGAVGGTIERDTLLVDDFLLYREGALPCTTPPSNHINETAQVVLLGVTPGWTQMHPCGMPRRRHPDERPLSRAYWLPPDREVAHLEMAAAAALVGSLRTLRRWPESIALTSHGAFRAWQTPT